MKDITKKNVSRGFWHGIVIVCGIVYLALALGKLTITHVEPSHYVTPPTPTYHYLAALTSGVYEIPDELYAYFRRSCDNEVQDLRDKILNLEGQVRVLENENKGLTRASGEVVASYEKKVKRLERYVNKPSKVIKKGESYWKVTYDIYIDYTLPSDGRVEFYGRGNLPDHLRTPINTIVLEVKTEDDTEKALVEYLKQKEMNDINVASLAELTKFIK